MNARKPRRRGARLIAVLLTAIMALGCLAGCTDEQVNAAADLTLELAGAIAGDGSSSGTPSTSGATTTPGATTSDDAPSASSGADSAGTGSAEAAIDEDGTYDSKADVALYLHTYGHLPSNYITKKEAQALGWEGGSLEPFAPGKSIGGDYFGNYEGLLPKGKYHECDIDTMGARSRGAKRIIWDAEGNIYYTGDHYETFEQLYGAGD